MADRDFVVKNGLVVNTNVLVVNGSNVGINTTTPDAVFTVSGTANVSGNAAFLGNTIQIGVSSVATSLNVVANASFKANVFIDRKLFVGNTATMVQNLPTIIQAVDNFNGFVMVSSQNLSQLDDACADLLIYADNTNGLSNFNDLGINNSRFDGRIHRIIVNASAASWSLGETVFQRNGAGANIAVGQIRDITTINSTAVSLKIRVSEDDGLPTYVGMANFSNTTGSNLAIRAVSSAANADVFHAVAFFSPEANTLTRRNYAFTVGKRGDGYLYNANSALTIGTTPGGIRSTTVTVQTSFGAGVNTITVNSGNPTNDILTTNSVTIDMDVTGTGIDTGTYVTSMINSTAFRISKNTTGTGSGTITLRDEFYDLTEANNPIIFHVGGMMAKDEIARFSGTGNFTIGPPTTSRNSKLTVNGTANLAGQTNVGANLNVTGVIAATQNVTGVSGVFTTSVNVSTISLSGAGLVSGNVTTDVNTLKIAGNSSVSSVNAAAGNLTIGNTSVTNSPLIRVQNSASQANMTAQGLAVGNSVVNSTMVSVGANVRVTTSNISVGNASTNVVINPSATYAMNVTGNAAVSGNLYVGGGFTVAGPITYTSTLTATGNLEPSLHDTYAIGNNSYYWSRIYVNHVKTDETGDVVVGNSTSNVTTTFENIKVSNSTGNVTITSSVIDVGANVEVNSSALSIGNSTSNAYYTQNAIFINNILTINSTSYRGTSNSANFIGTVSAANSVSNAQLQANLVNYTNTSHLTANLARYLELVNISGYNFVNSVSNSTITGVYTYNANLVVNASSNFMVGNTSTNNVLLTNNAIRVGNSTVNVVVNSSAFVGNVVATTITGNLTGNVVGNTTGVHIGNVTATTLSGNLTGNVVASLAQITDGRIATANVNTLNATSVNSSAFTVGTVFVANSTALAVGANVTITGNLIVTGSTITMNAATLDITDLAITVAKGAANPTAADGAGLVVDGANASLLYRSATDRWVSNVAISVGNSTVNVVANSSTFVGNVIATSISGNLTAVNISGNLTGNVTSTRISASANVTVGANVTLNSSALFIGNSTVNSTVNSTFFTGTANNTSFVGSTAAASVVNTATLATTLADYQTEVGLAANVATLTSYDSARLNGQLPAFYQTAGGLAANVATLTSNNATYFSGQLPSYYANVTAPIFTTTVNVGSNVSISTSRLFVGNTTANMALDFNTLSTSNSTVAVDVNPSRILVGNSTSNALINSTAIRVSGVVWGNNATGNRYVNTTGPVGGSTGDIWLQYIA